LKDQPAPDTAALTEKLKTWQSLALRQQKIEAERAVQLETLLDTYERKAQPINEDADRKLDPILEQMQTLEKEIETAMLAGIKADGSVPIAQLETPKAIAQVHTSGKREIDAAAFFRATSPRLRITAGFYECLTVQIGKAEKFLEARTMARLAIKKLTHTVGIKLKET